MVRRVSLAVALALSVMFLVLPAGMALAQTPPGYVGGGGGRQPPQPQGLGGFLDSLFGGGLLQPFRPLRQPVIQSAPAQPSEPPLPTVVIQPKDPDAKKILVVGDFVADGLAWGLDQEFADEPKLAVTNDTNDASGLARDDYYDWDGQLPGILNREKPNIVVVELGVNDRQQIRVGNNRLTPHSDDWEKTYNQRIAGIVETLKVYGRPFLWISAPPLRVTAASRDMAYLNGFYSPPVTAAGGTFVDLWPGFTDQDGNYVSSGPDKDGQLRALRTSDGINFTRAGRLTLAFYAEREIRRLTGAGGADTISSVDQATHIEVGPDGQKRLVGPVISLSDPLPGASDVLAGGPGKPAPQAAAVADTPREDLIVKGVALPVVPGRADDFAWPPPAGTTATN